MKKVLIIKIGAIGDVIMALPMLTYLRSTEKELHITWLCGEAPFPLLQATGLVDEIITLKEKDLLLGSFLKKALAVAKVWKALAFRSFDSIFIAQTDRRYKLLALLCRGKKAQLQNMVPGRYHSHEYIRLITGKEDPKTPASSLPSWNYPLNLDLPSGTIIALAPGGAKNVLADDFVRRWPIEHYVALAEKLIQKGYTVLLTGGEGDLWAEPYFKHLPLQSFIGKTSLPQLVSLYQRCNLVITHDCGPLHMAKLAGVPQIALFGPTIPSVVTSSREKTFAMWGGENLPCRPCLNNKKFASCTNNLCMKQITPEQVLQAAHQVLLKLERL